MTKGFFRRNWFTTLGFVYGVVSSAAGYGFSTVPFWVGLAGILIAYAGAHLLDNKP